MPKFVAPPAAQPGQHRKLIFALVLLCALAAAYLSLVVVTRVERLFFPGNPISVPGGSSISHVLPGIDVSGDTAAQPRINILVMGVDDDYRADPRGVNRPQDEQKPLTRTDTIEVVSVDPKTKSAAILGIPRDLWVRIPGRHGGTYQDRVNTPIVVGTVNQYPEGGIGLEKEVIENNLHIKINHYVLIDFAGFVRIIDALGGIDVDVPNEVYDPYYSETELPGDYDPQHFYPGVQHMDGRTALAYSRIRFSSDDLDRIERQQRVIFATIAKAESLNVLTHALSLWQQYKDTIQTDISDFQIPGYALLAKQLESHIHALSLGPYTAPYTTPQGAEVLAGNWDAIQRLVNAVFIDRPSTHVASGTPAPVRVEIENGAGMSGLAGHVVAYVASKGYARRDLSAADAYDGRLREKSEIIDRDGTHQQIAYLLANWLGIPVANMRNATASEAQVLTERGAELAVVLGTDRDFSAVSSSAMQPAGSDDQAPTIPARQSQGG